MFDRLLIPSYFRIFICANGSTLCSSFVLLVLIFIGDDFDTGHLELAPSRLLVSLPWMSVLWVAPIVNEVKCQPYQGSTVSMVNRVKGQPFQRPMSSTSSTMSTKFLLEESTRSIRETRLKYHNVMHNKPSWEIMTEREREREKEKEKERERDRDRKKER